MQIRDIFATRIHEKIEPVVKVADRSPAVVHGELANLVVTPQWERHLHRVLDAYVDAADRENEQGVGIWISGFFGSGKSLLMKVLGVLLEGGELQGQSVHDLFLSRLPVGSHDRREIEHFLTVLRRKIATTAVGGNLHSMLTDPDDRLPLIVFKLFASQRGYTHNWPFAWVVEYQIDAQGLTDTFRRCAEEKTGAPWSEIVDDPEFYLEGLYPAAAAVLPDRFATAGAVETAVNAIVSSGIDDNRIIDRLRRWCEAHDRDGRRQKLLLQLDELGQWIAGGNANDRTMQVQSLVETAAERGAGRIWIAVTAHGDIQALQQNVQQEYYAKIIQRFDLRCKLSNEDISQVVEERVLRKTQEARSELARRFEERSGAIVDLGSVERPERTYPEPDSHLFPLFYPYLPWTVHVIPDVVKGIAQAANRDEALTGSNRTMLGVVQGGLIEPNGPLQARVGKLVSLADLYRQVEDDVPVETKTDLRRIADTVADATPMTTKVGYGLFLLGQARYIPTTLDNVARTVVDDLDTTLSSLRNRVKAELDKLIAAGYAKQVGDEYAFLNTQQRTFQDKVRALQSDLSNRSYDLGQRLRDYASESVFRIEQVPLEGREMPLRVELDGNVIRNPSGAQITVRIYSPIQRTIDPPIGDDNAMRQRSSQDPNTLFLRMGDVKGFRGALALAAATKTIADEILQSTHGDGAQLEVARQARQMDLPEYEGNVRRLLGQSMRAGEIFFRGSVYQLGQGDSAAEAVIATLAQILPFIFPRFAEVPQRIANEQAAVRAALSHNTSNSDLVQLGVYRSGGELNQGHPLLAALRARLPLAEQDQGPIYARDLRSEFESPPFGWDGNAVKVGLALLLRESECRLIDSGAVINDPNSSEAVAILANESRFRNVRVQGVRTGLDPLQLREIRDALRRLFPALPNNLALVVASLHNALGDQLTTLANRAAAVQAWTAAAGCPVPQDFLAGVDTTQELLNLTSPERRLISLRDQRDLLERFVGLLDQLDQFHRNQGERFAQVRDFYTSMVNANADLPAVRTFLKDYRTVEQNRTLTDPKRWQELVNAYHAAQAAVVEQIEAWRAQVQDRLDALNPQLEQAVTAAGVPPEQVRDEAAALSALYDGLRDSLKRDARTFGETRSLLSRLLDCDDARENQLRELRARYAPLPPQHEVALGWRDLVTDPVTIHSADDLETWLATLRRRVAGHLEEGKTVLIQ